MKAYKAFMLNWVKAFTKLANLFYDLKLHKYKRYVLLVRMHTGFKYNRYKIHDLNTNITSLYINYCNRHAISHQALDPILKLRSFPFVIQHKTELKSDIRGHIVTFEKGPYAVARQS